MRATAHLADQTLLLHLAAELAQSLFELLGILDDYSHNPSRIQAGRLRGAHPESSTARDGYVTDRIRGSHRPAPHWPCAFRSC